MLLSKVTSLRPIVLWKTNFTWLGFCAIVLILTNGFASLTLIKEYWFFPVDFLLTYGLLIFWNLLEAAVLAAVLAAGELLLEKVIHRPLDLLFHGILVATLVATWLIILLTLLRIV